MDAFLGWGGWSLVSDFLKLVPGIVLFPLTLMLTWKKIGHRAVVTYSLSSDQYTASRLSNIAITNCKDKPLVVHSVYILVDRHIIVPLKEYSPPLVVKGLESAAVECDPVSAYHVNHDPFEFDFLNAGEVYVITTGKRLKCELDETPSVHSIAMNERYELASKSVRRFNNHVYDHRVLYAVVFSHQGRQQTAFIDKRGLIGLEWPFSKNALGSEDMVDAGTVKAVIEEVFGAQLDGTVKVTALNHPMQRHPE